METWSTWRAVWAEETEWQILVELHGTSFEGQNGISSEKRRESFCSSLT